MFDMLVEELLTLNSRLNECGISLILGGGMGLFLRDSYLGGTRSPRYPVRSESRTTKDLDVLLTADVIVDANRMNHLRDVLSDLGYREVAAYFQFIRDIESGGDERTVEVKVDLLAAPPAGSDEEHVTVKPPRIRPKESEGIHGYLTKEAAGIEIGKIPIDLSAHRDESAADDSTVYIPSSFNYLILKLHAFHDRKDRMDPESDRGRHHAFDIFRIVTDMRESDWETAARHVTLDGDANYLKNAAKLQRSHFKDATSLGVIRLKENEGYRRHRDEFDGYISDFLDDLAELFVDVSA